jgi:hypothetical protein
MLTTSEKANPNYLCKVVELKNVRMHSNAHSLQVVDIDFQRVITGMDAKDGDVYIYFPIESKIAREFLKVTNSFSNKELNADPQAKGYFGDNCRVKATRLRGEKSMGYIIPLTTLEWFCGGPIDYTIGQEFDTVYGLKLIEKYEVKKREPRDNQGKKPKLSRLIEGQVHLHADTENLRKNSHKIHPNDIISITYKTHGTSWWVSNVLVKKRLSWLEKVVKYFGVNVNEMEYDLVYGSRRVVKNADLKDPKAKDHFFGYDLWEDIKDQVGEHIPKGYTLYGEMLGYDKNGGMIQKDFDYGCDMYGNFGKPTHKLEVYRITHTNPDGLVTELSYPEIEEFCTRVGLTPSHLFFYGKAGEWLTRHMPIEEIASLNEDNWTEKFIEELERTYNEKDCFMCDNPVPEEGIVVRLEQLFSFEAYKLKSFRFLEGESSFLDSGESDIESEN